jgi:hypothetical protein
MCIELTIYRGCEPGSVVQSASRPQLDIYFGRLQRLQHHPQGGLNMAKDAHRKAAAEHDNAAKAHRAAAECHDKGNQPAALDQSKKANECSTKANACSTEAHKKTEEKAHVMA